MPEHDSLEVEDTSTEVSESEAVEQQTGKTVPAERYNGAQRKITSLQQEIEQLKGQALTSPQQGQTEPSPPTGAQLPNDLDPVQLGQFIREFQDMKLNAARDKAVQQYPSIAPLRDFLQGESEDALMSLAREMSEKLGGTSTKSEQSQDSIPGPTAPPVPNGGGATPLTSPTDDLDAQLQQVLKQGREASGDAQVSAWAQFLRIKTEQAKEQA